MHLALAEDDNDNENEVHNCINKNNYGTSIRTRSPPTIAATGVRICLTVVHSIMPSLLAVVRARNSNNSTTIASAAKVRLFLEQVKFLLRLYLIVPYWKQQTQTLTTSTDEEEDDDATADCGVLMNGGMYRVDQSQETIGIPWNHARALQRRRNYVGERTGWKAVKKKIMKTKMADIASSKCSITTI